MDAYEPEEQAMGWYYYLETKLRFPFQAKCISANLASPLKKGEAVEVRRMAPEDSCSNGMLVLMPMAGPEHGRSAVSIERRWRGRSNGRGHRRLALLGARGYCF